MLTSQLLKEGTKNLTGLEQAILKNVEAVKGLAAIVKTSLGPNGMNKMVINRHGKLFVTSDAATIINELQVIHPAAKMCVMASEHQKSEMGDATNYVVIFCGELLAQAEALMRMGLHPSDVIRGFEKAGKKVKELLDGMVVHTVNDLKSAKEVGVVLESAIASKQFGYERVFSPIVAEACIGVLPKDPKVFNVDNIRVAKILGGSVDDSKLVRGVCIVRDAEGTIKRVVDAKVVMFVQGVDASKTDTKGTVFIENADELKKYNKTEENAMEEKIQAIHDAGVTLVVSGGNLSEMAMHFFEKFKIMVIKTTSKFELRRIARAIKARPLLRLGAPTEEECGHVDLCEVREVGSTKVLVLSQKEENSGISTILLRAATDSILDDLERAVDNSVCVYKTTAKDSRFVAGAGACEIELARSILEYGESIPGLDQYSIKKFGEAFEVIPRILAQNAGFDATEVVASLYSQHEEGNVNIGVDLSGEGTVVDVVGDSLKKSDDKDSGRERSAVLDHLKTKQQAIHLATQTAVQILRISQIIMAKQAGVAVPGQRAGGTMGSMDTDD